MSKRNGAQNSLQIKGISIVNQKRALAYLCIQPMRRINILQINNHVNLKHTELTSNEVR